MSDRDDCPECGQDVQFQGHYPGCSLDPKNKPAPSLYEKLSVRPGDQFVVPVSPVQWDAIKELSKPAPECPRCGAVKYSAKCIALCPPEHEPAAPVEGRDNFAMTRAIANREILTAMGAAECAELKRFISAFEAMRERLRRVHCASSEEHDVRDDKLTARVQELEGQAERQASEMHFVVQASQRLREERDRALKALAYAKDALSIFPDDLAEIARIMDGGE